MGGGGGGGGGAPLAIILCFAFIWFLMHGIY